MIFRFSLFFTFASCLHAADWPEWRGPAAQGMATIRKLPLTFSETSHVTWKTPIPGRGHSTPVLADGQLWLTTAIEHAADPLKAKEKLKNNTGDQPVVVLDKVSLRAICIDPVSGRLLHDIELLEVREPQWAHQLNSYASPTPVIAAGRLYAHFGALGTACLEITTQKVLWKNEELHVMHENGPGSTAVLWQDRLIAHFDGSDSQFIAAFDTATGKVAWKTARSGEMDPRPQQKKAYGTPLIVPIAEKPVLVSPAANNIYGYDPATGKELWKVAYGELGFSMSTPPVSDGKRVYFSTSYGKSQVIALDFDAAGQPSIAWRNNKNAPKMSAPVLSSGLLFYADDGGILSCVDTATGEALYRERLGGKFSSSPVIAGDKLIIASREGVVSLVKVSRTFELLSQNTLDGSIMASPSTDGDALFLRTDKALYRIEE